MNILLMWCFLVTSPLVFAMDNWQATTIERVIGSEVLVYKLPKTLRVFNAQQEEVLATLMVEHYYGFYFAVLVVPGGTIGKLDFIEVEAENRLSVILLANTSITKSGDKGFLGVGRALLDLLKDIKQSLHYASIDLVAHTCNSFPPPCNNNLLEFYRKMGFIKQDSPKADVDGIAMIFFGPTISQ